MSLSTLLFFLKSRLLQLSEQLRSSIYGESHGISYPFSEAQNLQPRLSQGGSRCLSHLPKRPTTLWFDSLRHRIVYGIMARSHLLVSFVSHPHVTMRRRFKGLYSYQIPNLLSPPSWRLQLRSPPRPRCCCGRTCRLVDSTSLGHPIY